MDAVLLLALLTPPLFAAMAALASRRAIRTAAWFNAVTMPVSVAAAGVAAVRVVAGGTAIVVGHTWRLDALSALLALLVSAVATMAAWLGPGLAAAGPEHTAEVRTYRIYANLFAATMLAAVSANNLGVMWIAIEATTVASALLIPMHRTKAAVEASWKYLLIGSVGIALAFTGTVLAFVDFARTGASAGEALNWTTLSAAAHLLNPQVAKLAFVFLLVGFGTKAGLVPMHTWLPDAHSEAPAPLSAMMSGVLLAVALYALTRWKFVVDAAIGGRFTDTLLIIVALTTLALGSISLVTQQHYKRLLAYSSIEHIGLSCFGLALGPVGIAAALLHLVGHAFAKSTAFLLSGRVLERYGTRDMDATGGLMAAAPFTGGLFALSVFALGGLPPFSLFLSEILIVKAGWAAGHGVLTGIVLVLLLVAFGSLIHHLQRMLFGTPGRHVPIGERLTAPVLLLALPLGLIIWFGVALPPGLQALLSHATAVLQP